MLPMVANASQWKYWLTGTMPAKTALQISPLLAMQWAKCPNPTTKLSSQMTMICPMVQWLAVTIQATSATSQPPTTPDQKA